MTIERVINHGIAYLRLTASLGLKKVGGRVVQRRKVVLSLGPMSRHDDGKPDYLRRLRESYRAGRPLIKELEPYVDGAAKGKVTVTFSAGDPTCLVRETKLCLVCECRRIRSDEKNAKAQRPNKERKDYLMIRGQAPPTRPAWNKSVPAVNAADSSSFEPAKSVPSAFMTAFPASSRGNSGSTWRARSTSSCQ